MKRAVAATAVLCLLLGLSATASAGGATRTKGRSAKVLANKTLPKTADAQPDALGRALARGRLTKAQYTLERARSLFNLRAVRSRWGAVSRPNGRDATLILRDLAIRLNQLSGDDLARAKHILARPDGQSGGGFEGIDDDFDLTVPVEHHCGTNLCFHWQESGRHSVPLTDTNANTFPDFIDMTMLTFENVYSTEIGTMGFRAPKSDETSEENGGNALIDVYLVNIGGDGLYGYCTTDDPNAEKLGTQQYPFYDVSSYCAVDNDYAEDFFLVRTPEQNMQVTAAHEFFHAVQFSYDILEDGWLIEGSAAWIEDEVYDDVNDNYQYLRTSVLKKPGFPIDYHSNNIQKQDFNYKYGAFIWWRFLSEALAPDGVVSDTSVIKNILEQVDASEAAAFGDQDSLKGTIAVIKARGATFKSLFNLFGSANFFMEAYYEEGAGYRASLGESFRPPVLKRFTLSSSKKSTGEFVTKLLHLSNGYVVFEPGAGAAGKSLKVTLDGPSSASGTAASLHSLSPEGTLTLGAMKLNSKGNGSLTVPFGEMSAVVLTMTNASTRTTCFRGTVYACQGLPKDDKVPFVFSATMK